MKVKLLRYTAQPEMTVAQAARLCYYKGDIDSLERVLTLEKARKLIKKVVKMGHTSVLEHASFTFAIEGVSRVLTHQLVRHRIASYSQQSQRYVEYDNLEYYIPESIKKNNAALSKYKEFFSRVKEVYHQLIEEGIPVEDARYVLPNATASKIIVTMNARALINFFELRLCLRAQYEIRKLANQMLELVKEVAPSLFAQAGPPCVSMGECREGEKGCQGAYKLEKKPVKK
jgi:thymidylate synthase (FAD)